MAVEQMKKLFLSLCFLATIGLAADTVCYPVECKLSTQTFTSETCAYWDKTASIYYLEACSSTSYCPLVDFEDPANSTCETTPTALNKYPGEKCTATSDCDATYATGGCVSGTCQGVSANGNCTHYGECNPGLYCSSEGKCVSQVKVGGECENDFQCVNGAGCNITSTATYGTCVTFFSVSDSARLAHCNDTLDNYLCASTMCDTNGAGEPICLSSVASETGKLLPIMCQNNAECKSTVDPGTGYYYTLDCVCGLNKHGYSFCNQWPGDPDFTHLVQMWKKWVLSTNVDKCNTLRRYNMKCVTDWWDSNDVTLLNYFSLKTNNWPYLQMTDECTQNIFLSQYFEVQKAYNALRNTTDPDDHDDTSSAILLGFSLSLLAYA